MSKKHNIYWNCQFIGWSLYAAINLIFFKLSATQNLKSSSLYIEVELTTYSALIFLKLLYELQDNFLKPSMYIFGKKLSKSLYIISSNLSFNIFFCLQLNLKL